MARSDNQKLKILYILEYLRKNSGPDRPVSAAELIGMLADHDIRCDRKTVYSDIAALQDFGEDILCQPGRNGGYYVASQSFELPELKLLIDAVQSSRFLTERKSRALIGKLCTLCSARDAKLMQRDVYVSGRVRSMNETIYYAVDTIQEAIARNRQITFRYFDWGLNGTRQYRDRPYTASPYGLCQDNGFYYLLAHSPRHGVTNYRLDRMGEISLTDQPRQSCPELTGRRLTEYAGQLFQMYSGQKVTVKLRFRRELANVVIDRFGKSTMLIPDGEDWFVFTVEVAESPLFFSWVMGFGSRAKILYPQSVAEHFAALCREILQQYE